MDMVLIAGGQESNFAITRDNISPSMIPAAPPVTLISTASIRNWFRISIPRAPIDIRRPISLVLSATETYMMFMMPTPPISREIAAIAVSKVVRRPEMVSSVLMISSWVSTSKSLLSSARRRCDFLNIPIISLAAASDSASDLADA